MLPEQLLPEIAVRSRNFNLLLVVPPAERLSIAQELHKHYPKKTKSFLFRHHLWMTLSQSPITFNIKDMLVALRSGSVTTIEFLHRRGLALPAASMDWATITGSLDVLKYLEQQGQLPTEVAVTIAARWGYFEIVKWLTSPASATHPAGGVTATSDAMATAAWGGHLDILEYLVGIGVVADEQAAMLAAGAGHLDVLRWLYNHGVNFGVGTYTLAVAGGHDEVIKFLESVLGDDTDSLAGSRLHPGKDVITWAGRFGNLKVLRQYLSEDPNGGSELIQDPGIIRQPTVVAELLRLGVVPTDFSLTIAAREGQLNSVRLLLDHDPNLSIDSVLWSAIANGHRDIVDLLLSYNPPITSHYLTAAVMIEDRDLEVWFRQRGVVEDYEVLMNYVQVGRLDDVERLFSILPIGRRHFYTLLHIAASNGHLSILEFLLDQLPEFNDESDVNPLASLYTSAATGNQMHVIQWLLNRQVTTTVSELVEAIEDAAYNGYLALMKLLIDHLLSRGPTGTIINSLRTGYLEVAQFLVQHGLISKSSINELFDYANAHNYRSLVRFAVDQGHEVVGQDIDRTVLYGNMSILKDLYPHTSQLCSRSAYLIAKRNNRDSIVRFLHRAGFERTQNRWFTDRDYGIAFEEVKDNISSEDSDPFERENRIQLHLTTENTGEIWYVWSIAWVWGDDDVMSNTIDESL